jgi:hypothetical protein
MSKTANHALEDQMYKVALDTVDLAELQARLNELGITATVIDPHGPGGGTTVVEYTGTLDALTTFISECWADDYLLSFITETD